MDEATVKHMSRQRDQMMAEQTRIKSELQQKKAHERIQKTVIFGPPGTGKTTTLISILEKEILENKVDPTRIAYVSFTRTGAYEGRDRAVKKGVMKKDQAKFFRTLHSICFTQMGASKDSMIESQKDIIKKFGAKLGMNFKGYYSEDLVSDDDQYLHWDFLRRNNPTTASRNQEGLNLDLLKWVGDQYEKMRGVCKLSDFTSIVEDYVSRGKPLPVDVAIIDEAQDLTTLQWDMVDKAFMDCKRIYYAGDDDQAIYEWSGADLQRFLSCKGERKILHKSYRLPKQIKEYAEKILEFIPKENRVDKKFTHSGEEGEVRQIMSVEELDLRNGEEWMILSRNKWHLKDLEIKLRDGGEVYTMNGSSSLKKSVLTAINAHQRVRTGKGNREDALMGSYFTTGTPMFDKPWFDEMDKLYNGVKTYYRRVIGEGAIKVVPKIHLSTIHRVKGGECDNVVLLTDYSTRIAKEFNKNHDAELRVYYVAVTRARKKLFLVAPKTKNHYTIY